MTTTKLLKFLFRKFIFNNNYYIDIINRIKRYYESKSNKNL